jgi:pimeloyl-ACP methyl ester carboxylesterase
VHGLTAISEGDRSGACGNDKPQLWFFRRHYRVSNEPRYRAIAVSATSFEPGFHTIFQEASPTFKMRFMFIANMPDEAAFDEFRKTLTWVGYADKINIPYLCCAGQADELSPIANTERLFKALRGPRQLVIYQESRPSGRIDLNDV